MHVNAVVMRERRRHARERRRHMTRKILGVLASHQEFRQCIEFILIRASWELWPLDIWQSGTA